MKLIIKKTECNTYSDEEFNFLSGAVHKIMESEWGEEIDCKLEEACELCGGAGNLDVAAGLFSFFIFNFDEDGIDFIPEVGSELHQAAKKLIDYGRRVQLNRIITALRDEGRIEFLGDEFLGD